MSNHKMVDELKRVLADTYSLYLKTQNYHWNIDGPHFKPLHELFEEHYTDMAEAIDETAEHIRSLGEKVDGRFAVFSENSSIGDGNHEFGPNEMLKDLSDSHGKIIESLTKAADVADDIDDVVLEDFFVQRLGFHRKAKWMIDSNLA